MFSKETTSHGTLAPLTGCKLNSSYVYTQRTPLSSYCLQSALPHYPPELSRLTLVQHKSEAQQAVEVSEVHTTGHSRIHHTHGALSTPLLPTATKWVHTWQSKRACLGM